MLAICPLISVKYVSRNANLSAHWIANSIRLRKIDWEWMSNALDQLAFLLAEENL